MAGCTFARADEGVRCTVCERFVKTDHPPERVYATCLVDESGRPRPWGPGAELRKILGCSAKAWPHYSEMNRLGPLCREKASEFARSLVNGGYVLNQAIAERFVNNAIDRFESKHSPPN
jgi:hypothetical protein